MKPYVSKRRGTYGAITFGWLLEKARWRRSHRRHVSAYWPRVLLWRDVFDGRSAPHAATESDTWLVISPRWRRPRPRLGQCCRVVVVELHTRQHAVLWRRRSAPDHFGRWLRPHYEAPG